MYVCIYIYIYIYILAPIQARHEMRKGLLVLVALRV